MTHTAPTHTVLHLTTVPMTLIFLEGQARFMAPRGINLSALSSPGEELHAFSRREGVPVYEAEMPRRISPLRDLVAVARIARVLRAVRPDVLHAHTPKGGLLGMLTGWLCRVPVRVYHVHGLPYATASGWRRRLLQWTEAVSCGLAHQVFCVSRSVRELAVAGGVCRPDKIKVLAGGSVNGVDGEGRFNPAVVGGAARAAVRLRHGIPPDARVVGFVGRLVRDKGVVELAEAWKSVSRDRADAHLLVVGPFEERDAVPEDVKAYLRGTPSVHLVGIDYDTPPLYAAMDVVALPTYREGFGVVNIEAAAMGLPVVTTNIPGCVDAVADGVTGTLVPPGDARALADAVGRYLDDPDLRRRHGTAARERALRDFRQEVIWEALYREYQRLGRWEIIRR
jgi:glycosyltransferase involved in cell wall biosynthesis